MRTLRLVALCALIALVAVPSFAANSCCANGGTCQLGSAANEVSLSIAATPDNTLTAQEKATGWKLLFDGRTLNGWEAVLGAKSDWTIEDGTIKCSNKGWGYLYTPETWGNFEFSCDFKVSKGANSGVFFRWVKPEDPVQTGFEMQVLDSSGKTVPDKHDCGALYDAMAPSDNAMNPVGVWNTADIKCVGSLIVIVLNGKRIVTANLDRWTEPRKNPDGTDNKFDIAYKDMARSGHIGFQDHGEKTWFKNVKVREL